MLNQFARFLSGALEESEREAVLGDLAETGCRGWPSVFQVLGLIVRREAAGWMSWSAWASGVWFVLAISMMTGSVTSLSMRAFLVPGKAFPFESLTLPVYAWLMGYAIAYMSPRTVWSILCIGTICGGAMARMASGDLMRYWAIDSLRFEGWAICIGAGILILAIPLLWGMLAARRGLAPSRSAMLLFGAVFALTLWEISVVALSARVMPGFFASSILVCGTPLYVATRAFLRSRVKLVTRG